MYAFIFCGLQSWFIDHEAGIIQLPVLRERYSRTHHLEVISAVPLTDPCLHRTARFYACAGGVLTQKQCAVGRAMQLQVFYLLLDAMSLQPQHEKGVSIQESASKLRQPLPRVSQ